MVTSKSKKRVKAYIQPCAAVLEDKFFVLVGKKKSGADYFQNKSYTELCS